MLKEKIIRIASDARTTSTRFLRPKQGTALENLVYNSISYNTRDLIAKDSIPPISSIVTDSVSRAVDGVSEHTLAFKGLSSIISETFLKSIKEARNVIFPKVNELSEELAVLMEQRLSILSSPYTIIPVRKHPIFFDSRMRSFVENYKSIGVTKASMTRGVDSINLSQLVTSQAVLELLLTSNEDLNKKITDWFEINEQEITSVLWNVFLTPIIHFDGVIDSEKTNQYLAVVLFSENIKAWMDKNLLKTYKDFDYDLSKVKQVVGSSLNTSFKIIDINVRSTTNYFKKAVKDPTTGKVNIFVDADKHIKFLEANGDPSHIWGLHIAGMLASKSLEDIIKDAPTTKDIVSSKMRIFNATNENKMVATKINTLRELMTREINALSETELKASRENYLKCLEMNIKKITILELEDEKSVLVKLICACLFSSSLCHGIFNMMIENKTLDEFLNPKENARLTQIRLLTTWLLDMCEVVEC